MVEELFAELRRLDASATKAPWKAERHSIIDKSIAMSWLRRSPDITLGSGNDGDAALIAAMRNALPDLLTLQAQCERQRAALERLVHDVDDLMDNSHGVTGLHLNGDVAPWSDLGEGGRFEPWLGEALADARDALSTPASLDKGGVALPNAPVADRSAG